MWLSSSPVDFPTYPGADQTTDDEARNAYGAAASGNADTANVGANCGSDDQKDDGEPVSGNAPSEHLESPSNTEKGRGIEHLPQVECCFRSIRDQLSSNTDREMDLELREKMGKMYPRTIET